MSDDLYSDEEIIGPSPPKKNKPNVVFFRLRKKVEVVELSSDSDSSTIDSEKPGPSGYSGGTKTEPSKTKKNGIRDKKTLISKWYEKNIIRHKPN